MAEPSARIRLFQPSDRKLVHFAIGRANMESLAVANKKSYSHPLTVSVWIVLSCVFVEIMHWWPNKEHGIFGYLRPLPAFASIAVPMLFLIDWLNRPYFEKHLQDALRGPDIPDISVYYSRSPSSGFWLLEYGDQFVGLIALDASRDSMSDKSATTKTTNKKSTSQSKGTSSTAMIRHFYVDEPYRTTGIQNDLLVHAVDHAFRSDATLKNIKAFDSPLIPYARDTLRQAGFHLEARAGVVGAFHWKLGMRMLERDTWEKREAT